MIIFLGQGKTLKAFSLFFLIPALAYGTSITVSGNPQPLIVHTARAGKEPESAIDHSTTYTLQVSPNAMATVFVSIDTPLPEGTYLSVSLTAPEYAVSIPSISLQTTPQLALKQVVPGNYRNLSITYEYRATVAAGTIPLCTKNIIFTLTENMP